MKKGYKKLLALEIILLITLLINSFVLNILNYYTLAILIFISLLISYFLVGFEKQRNRYKKDTIINILIYTIIYLLAIYLSGIFFGFTRSSYSLKILKIISNILPIILLITTTELLRYQIAIKGQGSKIVYVLLIILFVVLDTTLNIYQYNFNSAESIIRFICIRLLPSISKNLALTYIVYKSGYTSTIIYRIILEGYIYIVPILPDLGEYVSAILGIIVPTTVGVSIYNLFKKEDHNKPKENIRKNKKAVTIAYIITIIFLIAIVTLSSGKFRYRSLTIGSGSMEPNIHVGDIVIIERLNNKEKLAIKKGEILVYNYSNHIIVHRVVDIKKTEDNEVYYYTKGDANDNNDGYPIEISNIIGVTKFKVSYLGLPTVWLNRELKR